MVSTPLKNISQLGLLFPIYGKRKKSSKPPIRNILAGKLPFHIPILLHIESNHQYQTPSKWSKDVQIPCSTSFCWCFDIRGPGLCSMATQLCPILRHQISIFIYLGVHSPPAGTFSISSVKSFRREDLCCHFSFTALR